MSEVRSYVVEASTIQEVRPFIEKWHYSHNTNGIRSRYCFSMFREEEMVGATIFGAIAMANVWKKYAEQESDLIELRRLCCIDDTPRNAESYLIGKCLKWLKKNTDIKRIISYADKDYNHVGTIYKATNFECVGETAKGRVILYEGKRYHDKCIRATYNGKPKPFALKIKQALETGEAYYETTQGKYIYLYDLRRKIK